LRCEGKFSCRHGGGRQGVSEEGRAAGRQAGEEEGRKDGRDGGREGKRGGGRRGAGGETHAGVLCAVEGVEAEVTGLAVAALEHLHNCNEAENLEEAGPHEELLHGARLDSGVVKSSHLLIACAHNKPSTLKVFCIPKMPIMTGMQQCHKISLSHTFNM
jgi:hypothetical protein